jgi:hypothetical protein
MERLSSTVDLIYIHFDVDALDQSQVASTRLSEPNGPMRTELAAALEIIMPTPNLPHLGLPTLTRKSLFQKPGPVHFQFPAERHDRHKERDAIDKTGAIARDVIDHAALATSAILARMMKRRML